ncbi:5-formyltetrahydrofolate cyclo-ligase [Streptomyces sp. NPDC050738]|uniref:5-formyltetrahydrofolate cyclo-ligase n=1 Tax=Streptomyces sp. NPDC050738 TaxID=3154744 RepID=UPI003432201D
MNQGEFDKASLRRHLLAARKALTSEDVEHSGSDLAARALGLAALATAKTVAAYVAIGKEPATRPLLNTLRQRGVRVLLPVLLEDNDLDWGAYEGPEALVGGRRGLLEPGGARLGVDAVLETDAVLLPGLAVDGRGMRLGRGGGSYDRVLERIQKAGADPALVVLLYGNEVVARVPEEPHDHPVHAVVTPEGVRSFRP